MADDPSNLPEPAGSNSEILFYQTDDKRTQIDVWLEGETVWLNQSQMVEPFQTTKQNISLHIRNIFEEGELREAATVKEYLTVQTEGGRSVSRKVAHYNLDVIISVGYRVKSHRGTQFRIWATQRLREYLVKGFTLDISGSPREASEANTLTNCWSACARFAPARGCSGKKSPTSMPPASITI